MAELFKTLGAVAGLGGIALGVLLLVFRDVVRKKIFPTLTREQGYSLLRWIVVLTFGAAVVGICAWGYVTVTGRPMPSILMPSTTQATAPPQSRFRQKPTRSAVRAGGLYIGFASWQLAKPVELFRNSAIVIEDQGTFPIFVSLDRDNRLRFDIVVTDEASRVRAALHGDDFEINADGWDSNKVRKPGADALEIVDENCSPVLQLIYVTDNEVVLRGQFRTSKGVPVFLGDDRSAVGMGSGALPPIFKYPSREHPGELAGPDALRTATMENKGSSVFQPLSSPPFESVTQPAGH